MSILIILINLHSHPLEGERAISCVSQHQKSVISVARRGEFSRFVGFLAQKGGQIFEDGDLWELFKKGGILKNFTKIGKFSYFSTKC